MAKKGAQAKDIYPVIVLNPGIPRMGSPEFIQQLKADWLTNLI